MSIGRQHLHDFENVSSQFSTPITSGSAASGTEANLLAASGTGTVNVPDALQYEIQATGTNGNRLEVLAAFGLRDGETASLENSTVVGVLVVAAGVIKGVVRFPVDGQYHVPWLRNPSGQSTITPTSVQRWRVSRENV